MHACCAKSSLLRHVQLPSTTGSVVPLVSVGMAVKGAVVAGLSCSPAGLRHLIAQVNGFLDAVRVFVGIIVLSASVVLLHAIVERAEKQCLV
ncbi:ABC-type nitrate/sulfonate/bicarbonate transport system permease component [Bradyrhizobium sp. F1.13.1]